MIEAVNEDENQWKNYHKVPKKFRSLKLCGIDPKDFKFRLRTYRESVCKSGPSKEVFVKKAKKEGDILFDPNDFPSSELEELLYQIEVHDTGRGKIKGEDEDYSVEEEDEEGKKKSPGKISSLKILYKSGICLYLTWKPPGVPEILLGYVIEGKKTKKGKWREILRTQVPTVYVKLCSPEYHNKWIRIRTFSIFGTGSPSKVVRKKKESDNRKFEIHSFCKI
ncbi:hypothetical protein TNCT_339531 [Trichonephila clavata]|uniref:Fibronectin type-III domain-containing protein n=1 Tax=Trichonephila clavata TaxID=2740835 RepID=A0A8X6JIU0_TRICU|nr:hypothetical protein TNCT_339531 [Trichonephila clavata]